MSKARSHFLMAIGTLVCLILPGTAIPTTPTRGPYVLKSPRATLALADQEFQKKNYRRALKGYLGLVKSWPRDKKVPLATLQAARCQIKLKDWDGALSRLKGFLKKKPGTLHEARVFAFLATAYPKFPRYGYQKGTKLTYNPEKREGRYRYMYYSNFALGARYAERARKLFKNLITANPVWLKGIDLRLEAIRNNQVLVLALQKQGGRLKDLQPPHKSISIPPLSKKYNPAWLGRQKVLYVINEIPTLNKGRTSKKPLATALYLKARFLVAYPFAPPAQWVKKRAEAKKKAARTRKNGDPGYRHPHWFPGAERDPVQLMKRLVEGFPKHPKADMYLGFLGRVHEYRAEYAAARDVYKRFIDRFARSRYLGDVKKALANLRRPWFRLYGKTVIYPGTQPLLTISARNTKTIQFSAYRIDLTKIVAGSQIYNHKFRTDNFRQLFGTVAEARKYMRKRVARWTYRANDRGDHRQTYGKTQPPLSKLGAYLIHAKGSRHEAVHLLLISNIMVVEKAGRGQVFYLVTDSLTGRPQAGVPVLVREIYWTSKWWSRYVVQSRRLFTDKSGRATYQMVPRSTSSSSRVSAFVWRDDSYALTRQQYYYHYAGSKRKIFKVFATTDRPLYRPGHTVKYKHIVRLDRHGEYENAPDLPCEIRVYNAKGTLIHKSPKTTNEYGTVNGEFRLDPEAALGKYRVDLRIQGSKWSTYNSAGRYFRVEEYKKPEFKVTVEPSRSLARPGDKIKATIRASFYFGGPVTGGVVSYTIFRKRYYHYHAPPSRFDWLYGTGFGIINERPYVGRGALVGSGKGVTDKNGELSITLPDTSKNKLDYRYVIQARVRDLSRRTINGRGDIKVTKNAFYLFLYPDYSYYGRGDKARIKVYSLTPGNKPVAGNGTLLVERAIYAPAKKVRYVQVSKSRVSVGADGEAELRTRLPEVGSYRLTLTLKDKTGNSSIGKRWVWALGPQLTHDRFHFNKLQIHSRKRTWKQGEMIDLMLTSPVKNGTLWFSVLAGDEIIDQRVVTLKGAALRLRFAAKKAHAPNFYVRAAMVHGNKVHFYSRELFVPPANHLFNVTIKPSSPHYKPGQIGSFDVRVTDLKGKPAQVELSLATFDASLLYIQRETAGDPRRYYHQKRRFRYKRHYHSGMLYQMTQHVSLSKRIKYKYGGLPGVQRFYNWRRYRHLRRGSYFSFDSRPTTPMLLDSSLDGSGVLLADENEDRRETSKSELFGRNTRTITMPLGGNINGKLGKRVQRTGLAPVRKNFADTAVWVPNVITNKKGRARIKLRYPDSLTTWAVRAIAVDHGTRIGYGRASVITKKPLIARLETPRFLIEGDNVTLAAIVHNKTARPMKVKLELHLPASLIRAIDPTTRMLEIPAHGEKRIDIKAVALKSGSADFTLSARSEKHSDRLKKTIPVVVYGAPLMVNRSGVLRKPGTLKLGFDVPRERRPEATILTVVLEPSMGGVLLSALPYLLKYPYGCVEQTMSRFLPAVLVKQTLSDLGIDLHKLAALKKKASLVHPLGMAHAWWYSGIRSDAGLKSVVNSGLTRLRRFQNSNGSWGWWAGGRGDAFMTAYVVSGLLDAKQAGISIPGNMINRGLNWLRTEFKTTSASQLRVYIAYALARGKRLKSGMLNEVYAKRDKYTPYTQSLLALTLHYSGESKKARQLIDNLADLAWVDKKTRSASFKPPVGSWWWWYNDRVETVARALDAFITIHPGHKLEPLFARWLVQNRTGNRWSHTRSTAMAIRSLASFMKRNKELKPNYKLTLRLNNKIVKQLQVTKANVLSLDSAFILKGKAIGDGRLQLSATIEGQGSLYATAFLSYFSKQKKIPAQGSRLTVKRQYFRLIPTVSLRKTWNKKTIKIRTFKRVALPVGAMVKPGDLVEVKLTLKSNNDYSYLIFEDFKPAGFEPVSLKSGYRYNHGLSYNLELRDQKTLFFIGRLGQGTQVLTYRLRAGIPGTFSGLPHQAHAMYAPRIRANSTNTRLSISVD